MEHYITARVGATFSGSGILLSGGREMAITVDALRTKGCPGSVDTLQATVEWLHVQELFCFSDLAFVKSLGDLQGKQLALVTQRENCLAFVQGTMKFQLT